MNILSNTLDDSLLDTLALYGVAREKAMSMDFAGKPAVFSMEQEGDDFKVTKRSPKQLEDNNETMYIAAPEYIPFNMVTRVPLNPLGKDTSPDTLRNFVKRVLDNV